MDKTSNEGLKELGSSFINTNTCIVCGREVGIEGMDSGFFT